MLRLRHIAAEMLIRPDVSQKNPLPGSHSTPQARARDLREGVGAAKAPHQMDLLRRSPSGAWCIAVARATRLSPARLKGPLRAQHWIAFGGECRMKIRVGYELNYDFPQSTPIVMVLGTHFTRA